MQRKINSLVIIGVVGTCVFGSHFAAQVGRSFLGNRDIWWTPKIMALSLDETRQDFEILLRGELLQGYLGRGALSAADADGSTYLVTPQDIGIRLNNWHKVNASLLRLALPTAFLLGVAVACLVFGLVQMFAAKKPVSEHNDSQAG